MNTSVEKVSEPSEKTNSLIIQNAIEEEINKLQNILNRTFNDDEEFYQNQKDLVKNHFDMISKR